MSEYGIDPKRKIQDRIIISFVAIFCLYYGITLILPATLKKIQCYYDKVRTISKVKKRQTEEIDVPVTRITNLDIQEGTQHPVTETIPTIKYRIPTPIPPSCQKVAVRTGPNSSLLSTSNDAEIESTTKYSPSRRFMLSNPSDQRVIHSNMSINSIDLSIHSNNDTEDNVHEDNLSDEEISHLNIDTVEDEFHAEYLSINDDEYAENSEECNMQVPDVHTSDSDAVLTINPIDTLRSLW
eukprot:CAMPEP_0119053942 /NCGR_PEP_ID=MMETSP1177-20130426/74746_1 /TAXON_ID=2985 /ORGANISM="Ochromonas sp, Strain CCMP1899" /LENGTH=238 /DNA_ID=CAMNT_0007034025 /DNA_START=212 /DNA_END=925 /DNA_ORIENTATION=-